jgi:hypothetical protein
LSIIGPKRWMAEIFYRTGRDVEVVTFEELAILDRGELTGARIEAGHCSSTMRAASSRHRQACATYRTGAGAPAHWSDPSPRLRPTCQRCVQPFIDVGVDREGRDRDGDHAARIQPPVIRSPRRREARSIAAR